MALHSTVRHVQPGVEIDIVLAGQTGVGKSSVINMIMGVSDDAEGAARVSNDASPCTAQTTSYSAVLETSARCRLWDTRGLDEAVNAGGRWFMAKMADRVRLLASQQARELREMLQARTRVGTPILVWCIDATKIDIPVHWQQFHKVYVEYCKGNAMPVVVITRMSDSASGWEGKCRSQLGQLDLGDGHNAENIPLLVVRKYRSASYPDYIDDSRALRALISELTKR